MKFLNKLFKFLLIMPVQLRWVCTQTLINPFLMNIFVLNEVLNLDWAGLTTWLLKALRQSWLPIGIDHFIAHMLEHLDHFGWPFVKVNRFDFSNVYS